jgi:hypothetical protein
MKIKTVRLLEQHSELILSALESYRRELETSQQEVTRGAAECQAGYDKIKDDPAACAAQDRTMVTTAGLYHMARMFTESAQDYTVKIAVLDEIAGALDPCENDEEY